MPTTCKAYSLIHPTWYWSDIWVSVSQLIALYHQTKSPLTFTRIWLLSFMLMGTIAIHSQSNDSTVMGVYDVGIHQLGGHTNLAWHDAVMQVGLTAADLFTRFHPSLFKQCSDIIQSVLSSRERDWSKIHYKSISWYSGFHVIHNWFSGATFKNNFTNN